MLALFNLGGGEIILVLALVLILFGAKKLPELAQGLGQGLFTFRREVRMVTDDVLDEVDKDASDAGRSLGGIYGKAAAQAIAPDNHVAELYDPEALRRREKPQHTTNIKRRFLSLLRSFLRLLGAGEGSL